MKPLKHPDRTIKWVKAMKRVLDHEQGIGFTTYSVDRAKFFTRKEALKVININMRKLGLK